MKTEKKEKRNLILLIGFLVFVVSVLSYSIIGLYCTLLFLPVSLTIYLSEMNFQRKFKRHFQSKVNEKEWEILSRKEINAWLTEFLLTNKSWDKRLEVFASPRYFWTGPNYYLNYYNDDLVYNWQKRILKTIVVMSVSVNLYEIYCPYGNYSEEKKLSLSTLLSTDALFYGLPRSITLLDKDDLLYFGEHFNDISVKFLIDDRHVAITLDAIKYLFEENRVNTSIGVFLAYAIASEQEYFDSSNVSETLGLKRQLVFDWFIQQNIDNSAFLHYWPLVTNEEIQKIDTLVDAKRKEQLFVKAGVWSKITDLAKIKPQSPFEFISYNALPTRSQLQRYLSFYEEVERRKNVA